MKWIAALCVVLVAASIGQAQEEPKGESAEAQADGYLKQMDKDEDGVVLYDELKTFIKKEAGQDSIQNLKNDAFVKQMSICVPPYLAADADDDCSLTRAELIAYFTSKADKNFQPTLSAADMRMIEAELIDPIVRLVIKETDKDGDGELTLKESAEASDDKEGWKEMFVYLDTDNSGKLGAKELGDFYSEFILHGYQLPTEEYDYSACYRKKGTSWIVHFRDYAKDGMSFYQKIEVVDANEEQATLKTTMLDKDLKPVADLKATQTAVAFASLEGPTAKGKHEPVIDTDTVEVAAGKFKCRRIVVDEVLEKTTTWYSLKHPGLLVRVEKVADRKVAYSYELMKFTEGED